MPRCANLTLKEEKNIFFFNFFKNHFFFQTQRLNSFLYKHFNVAKKNCKLFFSFFLSLCSLLLSVLFLYLSLSLSLVRKYCKLFFLSLSLFLLFISLYFYSLFFSFLYLYSFLSVPLFLLFFLISFLSL